MLTLINGHVQNSSAQIVPNGSIELIPTFDSIVIAPPSGQVISSIPIRFQFDANGNIKGLAQVYSAVEVTPSGLQYLVSFFDQNGARLNVAQIIWNLNQAAGSTVDISAQTNAAFFPQGPVNILGAVLTNPQAAQTITGFPLTVPTLFVPNGTAAAPSYSFSSQGNAGFYVPGPGAISVSLGGVDQLIFAGQQIRAGNGYSIGFTSTADPAVSGNDTAISRIAAANVAVGNGTQGDASGGVQAAGARISGTPSFSLPVNGAQASLTIGSAVSPVSATNIIGDGTGWQYWFAKRISSVTTNQIGILDTGVLIWPSSGTTVDTGLSRAAAAMVVVGNGTQGDTSGTLKANQVIGLNSAGGSSSAILAQGSSNVAVGFNSTGGAADQKLWDFLSISGTSFSGRAINDANNSANGWLTVTRGSGFTIGNITFGAGGGTQTLFTSTDQIVGRATTDTLTNKTLTSPTITGTASGTATIPPTMLNSTTGSGAAVLATSPTITTPSIGSPTITGTASGTATLPQGMVTPGANGQCLVTSGAATTWGSCVAGIAAPQINTTAVTVNAAVVTLQSLQSVTFAANTFNTVGKTFTLEASGVFTPAAATGQTISIFVAGLGLNSANAVQSLFTSNSNTTQYQFTLHYVCSVVTTGASGTFACTLSGATVNNNGVTNLNIQVGTVNTTNAVNLTAALTMTTQISFGTGSTANTASGLHLAVIPNN